VQNWRRAGEYGNALLVRGEVQVRNRDSVFAKRNSIKMKLSRVVGDGSQSEFGSFRFQDNLNAGNRPVLGIVDDARTVPKTVASAAPVNGKNKSTNHNTLRMRTLLLNKNESRGSQATA